MLDAHSDVCSDRGENLSLQVLQMELGFHENEGVVQRADFIFQTGCKLKKVHFPRECLIRYMERDGR